VVKQIHAWRAIWVLAASVIVCSACADIWGFDDLRVGGDASLIDDENAGDSFGTQGGDTGNGDGAAEGGVTLTGDAQDSTLPEGSGDSSTDASPEANIDASNASQETSVDAGPFACPADATADAGQFLITSGASTTETSTAPLTLDFGDVPVGTVSQQVVTITNLSSTAVVVNIAGGAVAGGPPFGGGSGSCNGTTLAPCGSCQIVYTFTPTTSGATGDTAAITLNRVLYNLDLEGAGASPGSDASTEACGPPEVGGYSNICITNSSGTDDTIAALPGPCWCTPTCECLLAQASQLNYCQYAGSGLTPTGCTWVDGAGCNSTVLAVVTCE